MNSAIVLTNGLLESVYAKTTHGLIRGPSRYDIRGIVDKATAGRDAGEVLDGKARGIPIAATVRELIDGPARDATIAIAGIATDGGMIPDSLRSDILAAADAGLSLINGLHQLVSDDEEISRRVAKSGASILDLRKPRPVSELHFWSGEILDLEIPRVAVLGMECAVGKRTTTVLLRAACADRGMKAEMIYTGQTGWLQGHRYGFIFDATPNDFVAGELEHAILACASDCQPDVILLEGQSGLRNPSGPCGSEFILSAGAAHVVLQYAPAHAWFEGLEARGCALPSVQDEIELIRNYGAEVCAVTLNEAGLEDPEHTRAQLEDELQLPVVRPLHNIEPAVDSIIDLVTPRGNR